MDPTETLFTIAELALGLAGFSGVVVALGKSPREWPRVDRLRLSTLLTTSFGALFLALTSLLVNSLGFEPESTWKMASGLMSLHGAIILMTIVPTAWRLTRETTGLKTPYSIGVFVPMVVLMVANVIVQAVNALIPHSMNRFGLFLGGLILLLLISGIQFVRLLFLRRD